MKEQVFEKVKELIVNELACDSEKVTLEASLEADLGADSIDAVQLIMAFEDEFGLSIPDEEAVELKTVGAIVDLIVAKKSE